MLPLSILALAALQTDARPLNLKLGPGGEIEGWLVAKEPKTPYGAEGGEWKFAYASPRDGLDLGRILGGENTHALAATTLVSDRARKATLLFGTDDGGTVTLNGKPVWQKTIVRGVRRDEERVDLDLKAGENVLIFRVDQGVGGWGMIARLEKGEGVTSRVAIVADAKAKEYASIRAAAVGDTTRGNIHPYPPFDAELAERYDDLRDRVALWNARIGRDADLGKMASSITSPLDGNVDAAYERGRRALQERYDALRAPSVAKAQNPGPLFGDVKAEIGIRVMPGGRQFVDAKGKPFIPIGYNHNPDWTELGHAYPLHGESYDPARTDRWFAKLKANGVNVLRMMAETPPSGNLEDKVGTFSPEHMTWLDNIVTSARKHGIRIMLTPYDTFWMNLRADASPYWTMNGGPVDPTRKIEWYTAPALREAHKRRNRWLVDRYGNLDTIFVWEPMNEADIWWDPKPEQLKAWSDDVVRDARDYQKKRWGVERLISISSAHPMPEGGLAEYIFRDPVLDLANTHLYIGAARRQPKDPSEVVAAEAQGIRHALANIRDNRPYIDTENGPIDDWIEDPAIDAAVFHDQSWSHLASGGAGSGFRWPYRGPHHLTDAMLGHLKVMRRFSDAVDWTRLTGAVTPLRFAGEAIDTTTPGPGGSGAPNADVNSENRTLEGGTLVATGYSTPKGAILFVARTAASKLSEPATLPISGATPGSSRAAAVDGRKAPRLYDTERGVWIKDGASSSTINLPANVRSVCAVWDR